MIYSFSVTKCSGGHEIRISFGAEDFEALQITRTELDRLFDKKKGKELADSLKVLYKKLTERKK